MSNNKDGKVKYLYIISIFPNYNGLYKPFGILSMCIRKRGGVKGLDTDNILADRVVELEQENERVRKKLEKVLKVLDDTQAELRTTKNLVRRFDTEAKGFPGVRVPNALVRNCLSILFGHLPWFLSLTILTWLNGRRR